MIHYLISCRHAHAGRHLAVRAEGLPARQRQGRAALRRGQRGMTLIDFMVGMTVGLLVVLAAVGSIVMTRSSARTMTDSAALEQQATLLMTQIGQQISQAGAINAANSDVAGMNAGIAFDYRPIGIPAIAAPNTALNSANIALNSTATIFGVDGTVAAPGTPDTPAKPDTLVISYAAANDGAVSNNCIGSQPVAGPLATGNVPNVVVNAFFITANNDLVCGADGTNSAQPIAGNVMNMRVRYLTFTADGNVQSRTATQVQDAAPGGQWNQINGVQICLDMQGDQMQRDFRQSYFDCDDAQQTSIGRIHRIVKQTFYLRNTI